MADTIDAAQAGSPGWWFKRLIGDLGERRKRYQRLDDYYTNEAGIPLSASKAVRESYRTLMRFARTNYAELVVEAVQERMVVSGFRTGAAGDDLGDAEAWRFWQGNDLDQGSKLVHRSKLSMGDGYVIVGGVDPEMGVPLITPEDPREVIAFQDPVRRSKSVAALKVFDDPWGSGQRAFLYLPGVVYQAARSRDGNRDMPYSVEGWSWVSTDRLPFPVVPVVRFPNRENIKGRTWGEFETHLPVLDRINYGVLQRVEIATMQAFRQRAVKGVPMHDENGNEVDYADIFSMEPGAVWQLPASAEMWESGQVDLNPIRSAVKDDVQDLAAVTRTPLFYLTPEATNGSAEGASLAREGLVFKTKDRISETSSPWEQVMAIAFLAAGDRVRASRPDMEALWAPPERYSLAERFDAASKAQGAGVPWETVMADVLQFTPQQIERMRAQRSSDALVGALAGGPAPAGDLTPGELADAIQSIYLGVGKVITAEEARAILNRAGAGLNGPAPEVVPAGG